MPGVADPKNVAETNVKEHIMFSSRRFMVSWLTFKSLIHSVYFCILCEKVVQCESFTYNRPVYQTPFIEEVVFSQFHSLTSFFVD